MYKNYNDESPSDHFIRHIIIGWGVNGPLDMKCYQDTEGHVFDFGFGMNWNGMIKDAGTTKYLHKDR